MKAPRFIILALTLAAATLLAGCGWDTVDTGYRGVQIRFGEVVSGSLPEGIYFYNPFTTSMTDLDVREQKYMAKTEASTRDIQAVQVTFAINYKPVADQVHLIYNEVGKDYAEKLLPQVVIGELKNAIARYDAVNLIEHRNEAVRAAEKGIQDSALKRRIVVTRFEITDFAFTPEFSHAIEAKVTAEQDAARAKNITVRIQEEANQRVISAKAEAESIKIRTQALEKSPALIQYEAVQKWDGKLPTQLLGSAPVPFLDLGPRGK